MRNDIFQEESVHEIFQFVRYVWIDIRVVIPYTDAIRPMQKGNSNDVGRSSPGRRRGQRSRTYLVKRVTLVLTIVFVGAMVAGAFYLNSFSRANRLAVGQLPALIAWRVTLFGRKLSGGIPELSWNELWQMAKHQGGFGLESFVQGMSLKGAIVNPYDSERDHQIASHIFSVRCARCHGNEGVGDIGPPLNTPLLVHGDSDLAIYTVLRDGIRNTPMSRQSLSMVERWQLVGYVRQLQLHAAISGATAARLKINVTDKALSAGSTTDDWLTYSGSLDGHHYTPLNQITPANVSKLRLRWVRQFETGLPTIEATPLVDDGVIFITEPPSDIMAVDALNAQSGDVIWRYTRNVSSDARGCCRRPNRGLALLGSNLYLASFDGYLVCINANNGQQVWQTQVADPSRGYSLTGAPLIVNRSVVVGVAGGEYGIRGFLAAYDAQTGRNLWHFDTIPGPGEAGHETWSGDSWRTGGGPTWVTGSYDPSLDLIYWGVGNPSPVFSGEDRTGDNLYTESAIALHASSGKLAWHFQFTPHDVHDWDSAQTPILADIRIRGTRRKVICWPNRNGFYYVLDRITGQFLAGVPFVKQTWAKGLDPSGRPMLADTKSPSGTARLLRPASPGGINFQNSAFDPRRGLIFVPAAESSGLFSRSPDVHYEVGEPFLGSAGRYFATPVPVVRALDAASGTKKWEFFSPRSKDFSYGGLLATGGGLIFGSSGDSAFALDSATGREEWRVFLGGNTIAAPISFTVEGQQVIAISAGRALFLFSL